MKCSKNIGILVLLFFTAAFSFNDVEREVGNAADAVSGTWEDINEGVRDFGESVGQQFSSVGQALNWIKERIAGIQISTPKLDSDFWDDITPNVSINDISGRFKVPENISKLQLDLEIGGTLGHLGNKAKRDLSMDILLNKWWPHWLDEIDKWDDRFVFPRSCSGHAGDRTSKKYWDCKIKGVNESIEHYRDIVNTNNKAIRSDILQNIRSIEKKLKDAR